MPRHVFQRPLDHPAVVDENELCQLQYDVVVCLVARRMRTLLFFYSFPGCFPLLIDAATAPPVLQRMKEAWEQYQAIKPLKGAYFNKFIERSALTWHWNVIQIF